MKKKIKNKNNMNFTCFNSLLFLFSIFFFIFSFVCTVQIVVRWSNIFNFFRSHSFNWLEAHQEKKNSSIVNQFLYNKYERMKTNWVKLQLFFFLLYKFSSSIYVSHVNYGQSEEMKKKHNERTFEKLQPVNLKQPIFNNKNYNN